MSLALLHLFQVTMTGLPLQTLPSVMMTIFGVVVAVVRSPWHYLIIWRIRFLELQRSIRISTHPSLKLFVTISKHIDRQKYKLYIRPSITCTLSHLTCLLRFMTIEQCWGCCLWWWWWCCLWWWWWCYSWWWYDGDGDGDVCDVFAFRALRCNRNCLAWLDAAFNSSTFASSLIIKVFSRLSFFANFPGGSIFIVNALNWVHWDEFHL